MGEKPLKPLATESDCRLSVLIVNYNSGHMLRDCAVSLFETVKTSPMEVIVVDNASTDASIEECRAACPGVQFIENDFNNWFTGGTNQAIEASSGRYLLCLNPDTVCHPGAIDSLVEFLDRNPQAGIAGPKLLNGDGTLQPSCRKFLLSRYLVLKHLLPWRILPESWKKRVVLEYWDHDETIQSDWIIGACLLVRRKAVEEVGLKDEDFPMFHEETDWCCRMRKKGWQTWFLHSASITHFGSVSAMKYWGRDLVLQFYRGKHRFLKKHYGPLTLLVHRLLLTLLLTARLVISFFRELLRRNGDLRRETAFYLRGIAVQMGLSKER